MKQGERECNISVRKRRKPQVARGATLANDIAQDRDENGFSQPRRHGGTAGTVVCRFTDKLQNAGLKPVNVIGHLAWAQDQDGRKPLQKRVEEQLFTAQLDAENARHLPIA